MPVADLRDGPGVPAAPLPLILAKTKRNDRRKKSRQGK